MFFEIIATARDWAIILLALEAFALSLVTLFICYQIVHGLSQLTPKVALALSKISHSVASVGHFIERVMKAITGTLVAISARYARIKDFLTGVRRILSIGR